MSTLFDRLCAPAALELAARRTFAGKSMRPDVADFLLRRDANLGRLAERLVAGDWSPEPLRLVCIRDPKPRVIACPAPIDRVLQRALADLMFEHMGHRLMPEDFACHPGRGQHRAVLAVQRGIQLLPYAVHLDIRAYFPSIRLDVLTGLVARYFPDDRVNHVVGRYLEQGPPVYMVEAVRAHARLPSPQDTLPRGLPIGTALSQFLAAHVNLLAFDHFVKRELKVPVVVRYVDDVFLFARSRAALRRFRVLTAEWLASERGLIWKRPEAPVLSCANHVDALGYRVTRGDRRPHPRALRRLGRRVAAAFCGREPVDLARSVASTVGWVTF